jgi:hypothetical protein
MQVITKMEQDFRELVIQDIYGNLNQSLRSDKYLELWLQDLMDIKINTEIRLANLDDSEFHQGAMNHHRAMNQDREAIQRTQGFLSKVKSRIHECKWLLKSLRKRQNKVFDELLRSPLISIDVKGMAQELQDYRALLDRNNQYLYKNSLAIQGQLEGFMRHKDKCTKVIKRLSEEASPYKNILYQLICIWEDGEPIADVIEQAKLATGWDVPFREIPKNYENGKSLKFEFIGDKELSDIAS